MRIGTAGTLAAASGALIVVARHLSTWLGEEDDVSEALSLGRSLILVDLTWPISSLRRTVDASHGLGSIRRVS